VNLVDDVYLILSDLRGYAHLVDETADVLNRVVGSRVKLIDVERGVVVEGTARLAFVAGLEVLGRVEAVDGLGQDTGAGRFAHATRTAKQEGLRQGVVADGVLQGIGDGALAHDSVEGNRPVFSSGYDEIFHIGLAFVQNDKITTFSRRLSKVALFFTYLAVVMKIVLSLCQ